MIEEKQVRQSERKKTEKQRRERRKDGENKQKRERERKEEKRRKNIAIIFKIQIGTIVILTPIAIM